MDKIKGVYMNLPLLIKRNKKVPEGLLFNHMLQLIIVAYMDVGKVRELGAASFAYRT
jgi:hypothetical protein